VKFICCNNFRIVSILLLSILTTAVVFSPVLEFPRYILVLLIALLFIFLLQPCYFLTLCSYVFLFLCSTTTVLDVGLMLVIVL
jgi:hypothetical protein